MTTTHALEGAQYLMSTDADVIARVELNERAREAHDKAAAAFTRKYRVGNHPDEEPSWYGSSFYGSVFISAIQSDEMPTEGKWTKGRAGYGWRPFKKDPAYAEMTALNIRLATVPGLPAVTHGPVNRRTGASTVYTLSPFVSGEAAWVDCRTPLSEERQARPHEGMPDPDLWSEVKASDYHLALEALREQEEAGDR